MKSFLNLNSMSFPLDDMIKIDKKIANNCQKSLALEKLLIEKKSARVKKEKTHFINKLKWRTENL
jgi:hypothetical protein